MNIVTTVAGKQLPRTECVELPKQSGKFYQIGVERIKVNGRYYKPTQVFIDESTGLYHSNTDIDSFITVLDYKNPFSENRKKTSQYTYLATTKSFHLKDVNFIPFTNNLQISKVATSIWQDENYTDVTDILYPFYNKSNNANEIQSKLIFAPKSIVKELLGYQIFTALKARENRIYSASNSSTFKLLNNRKDLFPRSNKFDFIIQDNEFLKNITIGIEIETSKGHIPNRFFEELGFVQLYDGSITGHEYASIVFRLDQLHYLEQMCELLSYTHYTDSMCSVHVHIGNIPYTNKNMEAFYSLFKRLQNEIHILVYKFKKEHAFLKNKDKDHCRYLPELLTGSIEEIHNVFFGRLNFQLNDWKTEKCRNIIENANKWDIHGRYYFTNFVNYCTQPNGTIELRLLQGTFNFHRILNWLLINLSVIYYGLNNHKKIFDNREKIFLSDCVEFLFENNERVKTVLLHHITDLKSEFVNNTALENLQVGYEYFSITEKDRIKHTLY